MQLVCFNATVNFMTQIVPGLRDARVPLTVGAMWVAVCWLVVPSSALYLPSLAEPVNDLSRQWADLPTAIGLGALGVSTYLIGILMEGLGKVVQAAFFSLASVFR